MASTHTGPAASTAHPLPANRLLVRTAVHGGRWLVLLGAAALVLAAAEALLPAVLGRLIDAVTGTAGHTDRWLAIASVIVVVLVACDVADEIGASRSIASSTAWLRNRALAGLLSARPDAHTGTSPGAWAGRLVGNATDVGGVGPLLLNSASSLLLALVGIGALALIDPWLCLTFAAGLPILTWLVLSFVRTTATLSAAYLDAQGEIVDRLTAALRGSRTIAAAGTADHEARRVLEPLPELHRAGRAVWLVEAAMAAQDAIVLTLLEIAVLAVAGFELVHGRISVGELFAASQYVVLASAIGSSLGSLSGIARARAAAVRVAEVVALPTHTYGTRSLADGSGSLEFRAVLARDLDGGEIGPIDLVVQGRALVALVGSNGSGVTALARLAGRLEDPVGGAVVLDGVPLPELDHATLRTQVGYGFESPEFWGDTIADAVSSGAHVSDEATVRQALGRARAADFVDRLPAGLATPLLETPLSGGERQRVGLARAFAHGGRVLVLDDVASSLDSVTEHEIGRVLADDLADRTRLVVAHRVSTAARADLVVWMQDGKVRAYAPHVELWQQSDYRSLFSATPEGGAP